MCSTLSLFLHCPPTNSFFITQVKDRESGIRSNELKNIASVLVAGNEEKALRMVFNVYFMEGTNLTYSVPFIFGHECRLRF